MSRSMKQLVVLGATAFGEIVTILHDINTTSREVQYEVVALLDDDPEMHGQVIHGVPVKGNLASWRKYSNSSFVFLIGSHRNRLVRRKILQRIGIPRERFVTLIHPSAKLFAGTKVGRGCIIHPGVVIFNDTIVEDFVLLLPNSVIGAYCTVCEGALITTLVSTGSATTIGPYAHVGSGAVIGENIEIGAACQVAMGSFVGKSIESGVTCLGNPARTICKLEVPNDLLEEWKSKPCRHHKKRVSN